MCSSPLGETPSRRAQAASERARPADFISASHCRKASGLMLGLFLVGDEQARIAEIRQPRGEAVSVEVAPALPSALGGATIPDTDLRVLGVNLALDGDGKAAAEAAVGGVNHES